MENKKDDREQWVGGSSRICGETCMGGMPRKLCKGLEGRDARGSSVWPPPGRQAGRQKQRTRGSARA